MKKLISFFAAAVIVGVIGCDSMTGQQMMAPDQFKQFMDPAQMQKMMDGYQMFKGSAQSEIDTTESYVKSKLKP